MMNLSPSDPSLSDSRLGGTSMQEVRSPVWKTVGDRLFAASALILLAPIFVAIAVVIRSSSKGPIFFRQTRIGLGGRPFTIWKFRTLERDSSRVHEEHVRQLIRTGAPLRKVDDQIPVIRCGRFLRFTCLDELPQLINVLRGEMSLVGPRPLLPYEVEGLNARQEERHRVRPGVTGLWQVSDRHRTTFDGMLELDLRYAGELSPALDIKILLRTALVCARGAVAAMTQQPTTRGTSLPEEVPLRD